MKKLMALLLAMVMVLSLAACGAPAEEPAATTAAAAAEEAPATEAPATEAPLDPVTLQIHFHGSNVTPAASEKVMEVLNPILQEKLNVTLEPIWGTWGDFDQVSVASIAAGDPVDIYFTCNWSGNEYNKYAKQGAYVKLDDMLAEYAPDLVDIIPEAIWNSAKTDGAEGYGIYAVPGLKDTATQNTWDVNCTLLEELGFEVPEKLDYYSQEFEDMLKAAKDAKGKDFYPLLIEPAVLERMVTHTAIVTGDIAGANVLSYYYDAEHPSNPIEGQKMVNKYATPEFKAYAERTYYFAQQGYIAPDSMQTATSNEYLAATQASAQYLFGTQSYSYGYEATTSPARGITVKYVPETAPYMDATSGQGAMMAISATSANPERALMFLNLLNSDPEIMTMLNYGVEGFTYEKNEDGTISFIKENRDLYTPWTNGMGNVRILPATKEEGPEFRAEFSKFYEAAEALPMGTFILDTSEMESQTAALANVYAKYGFNLMAGAVDPATELPKFLNELEKAGINDFVDAANAQLDEFLK